MQTKEKIEKEIKRLQKYQEGTKDILKSRMCYAMSEVLRWAIEDTVEWDKPLEQVIDHANILKKEISQ